tara:strand:+ start:1107 stop:1376 length:270 start_codon:yes stop_codon:yes gene_type:complete
MFVKETNMSDNNDELEKQINLFKKQINLAKKETQKLQEANGKLQDEVDSLWAMLDEMTKADIENWAKLAKDIQSDTVTKALMVSKKADA